MLKKLIRKSEKISSLLEGTVKKELEVSKSNPVLKKLELLVTTKRELNFRNSVNSRFDTILSFFFLLPTMLVFPDLNERTKREQEMLTH
ncbi:hypothetical protein BpHYR1_024722 [Brachionus plicatilis]|uniref:Uncharacterized protein n=1 Tax=Brachionus plicatilis TaxID=10195 RepID=A0A3M7QUY9_BRAPC|nr:hypothetical protein BpHYR1_024722 [Brachionus plicatilis]